MQNGKLRVGLICGGTSCEHEISLLTVKNVLQTINSAKYDLVPIYIDKTGHWHHFEPEALLEKSSQELLENRQNLAPGLVPKAMPSRVCLPDTKLDVIFPLLHGPNGEDGTIQGFLKLAQLPFVGAQVLGSAIGMDKDVMKRLLRDAGLPIARFKTLFDSHQDAIQLEEIVEELGLPLFVKPANLGSSVGISKAKTVDELKSAIAYAFQFDRKVVIEESIIGREIECAVLGNDVPIASAIGEVITSHEFYSYDAKYKDESLVLQIPANIPAHLAENARTLALQTFKVLCCEGLARVDFFMKEDGKLLVNEINTIPGFTSVSMYPMLWEASGIGYSELIDRLIGLALDRHQKEARLKTSR